MASSDLERMNAIIKHLWTEPRFVAQVNWSHEYGLSFQLERQLGREAMDQFAAGHGWLDPDAEVSVVLHEQPDWAWWEPRYDSPGRRIASRDREFHSR